MHRPLCSLALLALCATSYAQNPAVTRGSAEAIRLEAEHRAFATDPDKPGLDLRSLRVGDAGLFPPGLTYRIAQVLSDSESLLLVGNPHSTWRTVVAIGGGVGEVDGEAVRPGGIWRVSRTKQYKTEGGGTTTMHFLEPVTMEEAAALIDAHRKSAAEEARKRAEAKAAAEASARAEKLAADFEQRKRVWVDASGKFRIEAAYHAFEPGHVILRKQDGSTLKVPLAKLAPADRRAALEAAKRAGHR